MIAKSDPTKVDGPQHLPGCNGPSPPSGAVIAERGPMSVATKGDAPKSFRSYLREIAGGLRTTGAKVADAASAARRTTEAIAAALEAAPDFTAEPASEEPVPSEVDQARARAADRRAEDRLRELNWPGGRR